MLSSCTPTAEAAAAPPVPSRSLQVATASATAKKKRRPAGTPDPDAEVVALSPRTLLQFHRFVCEICWRGFHRDQNLQMHRRRHNLPCNLRKREAGEATRKRQVFVCPEPSCLRHHPSHALRDVTGIKRHFWRKHTGHRQWACARCSRAYAVHADYKAHLRTCGTRGHACGDCGRVFSRAGNFVAHRETCNASGRGHPTTSSSPPSGGGGGVGLGVVAATSTSQQLLHADTVAALMLLPLPRTASSPSPSSGDLVVSPAMASPTADIAAANVVAASHWLGPALSPPTPPDRPVVRNVEVELQLMPPRGSCARGSAPAAVLCCASPQSPAVNPQIELSIGLYGARDDSQASASAAPPKLKEEAQEQLWLAMAEEAAASGAWAQARRKVELAERELAIARRVRQQAQAEFSLAHEVRDHAVRQIDATLPQFTCCRCRH